MYLLIVFVRLDELVVNKQFSALDSIDFLAEQSVQIFLQTFGNLYCAKCETFEKSNLNYLQCNISFLFRLNAVKKN